MREWDGWFVFLKRPMDTLPASVDAHETSTGTNVVPAQNTEKDYPTEDGVLRITARKDGGIPKKNKKCNAKGSESELGRKGWTTNKLSSWL